MNKLISLALMSRLYSLPFIDKFGGIVQTITKVIPNGDKPILKRIPISAVHQAPSGCSDLTDATSIHFIPESKLRGMLYFEDLGLTTDNSRKRHTGMNWYRSRLRLVVWVNQKNLLPEYSITFATSAMNQIIDLMVNGEQNFDILRNMKVSITSIPPATSALFANYDYNEQETQFLIPPYDFFALDLDIQFGVAKGCAVPILLDPAVC